MDSNKLTLDDKISEVKELIERRETLKSIFYRLKNYKMSVKIDAKQFPIGYQDKELENLINEYYKKELEKVDKKLNELLK